MGSYRANLGRDYGHAGAIVQYCFGVGVPLKTLLLVALVAAQCTPGTPTPTPAPIPTVTIPIVDAGPDATVEAGAPDPLALKLCYENFQALNPDLQKSEVIAIFCSTPAALAPWALRAAAKRAQ